MELAAVCIALVCLLALREWMGVRERREAAKERADLCQRIQAPDLAVYEHVREGRPERRKARPIAADDDAAFAAREKPDRG